MSDTGSARSAAETSVSDQCNFVTKPLPHNVTGGREHFLHTGSAFRSFVANNNNIAGFNFAAENSCACFFLRFKDDRRAFMNQHLRVNARTFHDRTFGGDISVQDGESALFAVGIFNGMNAFFVKRFCSGNILAKRFPGNRRTVELEQSFYFTDFAEDCADAARVANVFDMETR